MIKNLLILVILLRANKFAGSDSESKIISNQHIAKQLHKLIIRKSQKREVYSAFKDNIWGADLANMQPISTFDKGIYFLLSFIDSFSKYAEIMLLKDK